MGQREKSGSTNHLVIEELGDVWKELEAEVQLDGLLQHVGCYAACSVEAHLTSLSPQPHLPHGGTRDTVNMRLNVKQHLV